MSDDIQQEAPQEIPASGLLRKDWGPAEDSVEVAAERLRPAFDESEPVVDEAPQEPEGPSAAESYEEGYTDAKLQTTQSQYSQYRQTLINEAQEIQRLTAENEGNREYDRGEWAAVRMELAERQQRLQAAVAEHDAYVSQKQEAAIDKERQKLERAIPGWDENMMNDVVSYMKREGFTEQEINGINDARAVIQIVKAMGGPRKGRRAKTIRAMQKKPKAQPAQQLDVEAEIKRRRLRPGSMDAARLKIEALM